MVCFYQRGKVFFFVVVRFRLIGVAAGTASRWWEFVGNDGAQADRFDLSLKKFSTNDSIKLCIRVPTLVLLMNHYSMLMHDIFHHHHWELHRLHSHEEVLNSSVMMIPNNLIQSTISVLLMWSFDAIMTDISCRVFHEINGDNFQPSNEIRLERMHTRMTYFRSNVHLLLTTRKLKWYWTFTVCFQYRIRCCWFLPRCHIWIGLNAFTISRHATFVYTLPPT